MNDIVVLSSGEKFDPYDAERTIALHIEVQSALIIGSAKVQPAVLIEAEQDSMLASACCSEEKLESLKVKLNDANNALPGHAQIHGIHVKVVDASESFPKSSKGGVQRAQTTKKLDQEIGLLYQETGAASLDLDFSDTEALTNSLLAEVSSNFLSVKELHRNGNFFSHGMESLIALRLVRGLKVSLQARSEKAASSITLRLIYKCPTAEALADTLTQLVEKGTVVCEQGSDTKAMSQMLEKYKTRIESMKPCKHRETAGTKATVLLTGTTGSLGSYILDALLADSEVSQVMCLNRSQTIAEQQQRIQAERGLAQDMSRARFIEVKLSEDKLGLEPSKYQQILDSATHIVHNAWSVNFNLPLSAFEDQLGGCCRFIELSQASATNASIHFMSSVGAANNWLEEHEGPVPESPLSDFGVSEAMGYAQSKQLAELLFCHANVVANTDVTIHRLGQIAGPVKHDQGIWKANEWFPSLILGSMGVGKITVDTAMALDLRHCISTITKLPDSEFIQGPFDLNCSRIQTCDELIYRSHVRREHKHWYICSGTLLGFDLTNTAV